VFSIKNKKVKEEIKNQTNDLRNVLKEDEYDNTVETKDEYDTTVSKENEPNTENIMDISQIEVSNLDIEENDLGKNTYLENDLCEIDLEIPSLDNDIMQLKNRNKVYFEMYKEAKKKARLAREFALSAYLEAKRIKNTYLLDEAFDSDDEKEIEEKSLENIKI
jgi:hypothetical protein